MTNVFNSFEEFYEDLMATFDAGGALQPPELSKHIAELSWNSALASVKSLVLEVVGDE